MKKQKAKEGMTLEEQKALLQATKKLWAVVDDIGDRNPSWLGPLVLSDYGRLNEAFMEVPRAIAAAEKKL
jgi:hypothetical protein